MPVATDARPDPSRSTSTSTSVSLVLRFTTALRMQISLISAPFIRGLTDTPHPLRTVCKCTEPCLDEEVVGPLAYVIERTSLLAWHHYPHCPQRQQCCYWR